MEPSPPGPCYSPPGPRPRPVPPPRKGSMERRPLREPSEGRSPGGQPGTPERATVTQRVLIVMEGRSITAPSLGATEDTGLGGQRAPPPQYTESENQGPPPPGSTTNVPDLGPIPSQYTNLEIRGPPPLGSTTNVPDLGPVPPQITNLEIWGPPPPGSTTNVLDLGPVPPQYSNVEIRGPPPLESTTNVPDLGPVPPQYTNVEIWGAPLPGSTTNVLDLGPVPPQYTNVEIRGPPLPGSTTNMPDLGPEPPQYTKLGNQGPPTPEKSSGPDLGQCITIESQGPPSEGTPGVKDVGPLPMTEGQAMVTNGGARPQHQRIPPPRDSPRKAPPFRPVWVIPRKALEAAPLGATPTHHDTGLEQGTPPPAAAPTPRVSLSGEDSAIQAPGTSPPQDAPMHQVPSQGQRRSLPDTPTIMETIQDGGPQAPGAVASLLQKRAAVPEEVTVVPHVVSGLDTAAEKMVPPTLQPVTPSPEPPPMEAVQQSGPSRHTPTVEQPHNSLTPNVSAPPGNVKVVESNGTTLPDGTSQSSAATPQVAMTPGATTLPQEKVLPTIVGAAPSDQHSTPPMSQPNPSGTSLSPSRINDPSSPPRSMSSKPPLPIPPRSSLYPGHAPSLREQEPSLSHDTASLSSFRFKAPAPDTLSYLDSVSLMSGTLESLTHLDDASSLGSDSEINGMPYRKTDKYGFLGGNQFSGNGDGTIPVEIARQRELKWLDMFNNWDKWLTRRFQKVKLRCRKGIPSSLRARAWQYLCNSQELLKKNPGKFEEMERHPGDPKWLDVIEKDLHRQFPFHEMFAARGGHGQQDLYRILKAYTVYRPEEGYCQAQAPVAAVLLMHMPAEQAFWCLVQICDKYLPGYYSAGLEAIQLDGEIFFALLRRVCPMAYRHLKKFKIDPILYMTEWFMCIFSRTLPWSSVLRVWDMFFCEGVKIVFRVGLVLLRHTLGSVDKLRSCQGMYETMEKLRSLPPHCMLEEVLLPEVSSLPVTDALIERESNTQLRKWRENRGELQYRPSRRLHGSRQILEERIRLNPALSGSRLSLSSLSSLRRPSPPTSPALALQPESVVVSEGLRPVLPSPTANKAPLGPPKEAAKKLKEKPKEQDKRKEREERERERKREKEEREERERERKREKEEREERERERRREKQKEKEEKRLQKEKEKAEAKQKKERKMSFRRKESSSPAGDSTRGSGTGSTDAAAAHDTYF